MSLLSCRQQSALRVLPTDRGPRRNHTAGGREIDRGRSSPPGTTAITTERKCKGKGSCHRREDDYDE